MKSSGQLGISIKGLFENRCDMFELNTALCRLLCAFAIAVAISALYCVSAECERTYIVNGKEVSRNVYHAARLITQANGLISGGDLDRAASKLRLAIQDAPEVSAAHSNLGLIYARQGKNNEALAQFEEAIKSSDTSASVYINLASLYQSMGNLNGAINTFKLMIERFPADHNATDYADNTLKLLQNEQKRRIDSKACADGISEVDDYYLEQCSGATTCRWTAQRMPLKIYLDNNPNAEGYKPQYNDLLKSAFVDWERASNKKVRFKFVPSNELCDIECYWTNDPAKLGNGMEYGNTTTTERADIITHAQIVMRSQAPDGDFPFTDNLVTTTSRHEIGHALGIGWHSTNPQDVMYFSIPIADKEVEISNRDKNTLAKLYSKKLPWTSLYTDFISNPANINIIAFIVGIILALTLVVLLLEINRRKKKAAKKT